MRKLLSLLITILLLLCLCACNSNNNTENKISVAVSIAPQATFVEKVCGQNVNITTMIPAGASAENYELTAKEIASFSDADIYFTIGVPAEENGILPHISKDTKVVDLAEKVRQVYKDLEIHGERDPHIWLSPKRAKIMVDVIAKEISLLDIENSKKYTENAQNYISELDNLNSNIKNIFKNNINKPFFVFHPAFGYFADDYGLSMQALEEHGHEATMKDMIKLAETAKKKGVKVVFCQAEVSQKQADVFAKEIGGEVQILEPLSPDYINNLKEMAKLIAKATK